MVQTAPDLHIFAAFSVQAEVGHKEEESTLNRYASLLSVIMIVLLGALALLSPACGSEATLEEECTCPLPSDRIMTCDDDSQAILYNGNDITPCGCMSAAWVENPPVDEYLDGSSDVITAINLTPDGANFDRDGLLHFALPDPDNYDEGDRLTIWKYRAGTCDPERNLSSWVAQPDHATVIDGGFADRPIRHPSIYALVDMRGQVSALGRLVTPFTQQNGHIVFEVDVAVSSTHREAEGKALHIVVPDIKGDPDVFMAALSKIPVASVFAFRFDKNNQFTVWWDGLIVHFHSEDIQPR